MAQPPATPGASLREEQLRAWMAAYGPPLRRYFQKRASPAEAEDLVQDVFVAMQTRGAIPDDSHIDRYLFRVAANVLARRRMRPSWDWSAHAVLEEADLRDELSPERVLIARQTIANLLAALNRMPPRMAEAFVLHRFDEMTYGEIAEHMGITVKAVEGHIKRALERITLLLEAPR